MKTIEEIIEDIEKLEVLLNIDTTHKVGILNGGWIKCSDRLPDKEGHYLIHLVNGFTREYDVAYFFNNSYNNNWGGWSNDEATHWMPLPDPPEESK